MNMFMKMIKGDEYCYEKLIHPVRWTYVKVMNIVMKMINGDQNGSSYSSQM